MAKVPTTTNETPRPADNGEAGDDPCDCSSSKRTNKPKRETTKPSAMIVRPVRSHARSVRSAAKNTRGSESDIGMVWCDRRGKSVAGLESYASRRIHGLRLHPRSVEALLSFRLVARRGAFAYALGLIPHQSPFIVGQRGFWGFTRAYAVRPVRGTNGGKAG